MKKSALFISICLLSTLWSCQPDASGEADMIILGGDIYTANPAQPQVEAVVVNDGYILYAGDSTNAMGYRSAETMIMNLEGKTMTPGFIESHAHMMGLGYAKLNLDLNGISSYQALVDKVDSAAKVAAPGEWIIGRGWHQSKWSVNNREGWVRGFPVHDALSAVSPENPVYLKHASGHAALANAKAMEIAGVTNSTEFSDEGEIIKDSQGNPTGIFNELAQGLISKNIPATTDEKDRRALALAVQACMENGITSFHDAGAGQSTIDLYQEFLDQGKLDVRMWVMLHGRDSALLSKWYEKGPHIDREGKLTIRAIKLYADGALGSRGAWLLAPYEDREGHVGHATSDMSLIYRVAKEGLEHGFQVCTHAIGDRANREVLDQYEKALSEIPTDNHRYRVEHAQHIDPRDIPRFGQMGVIASMQAIHMSSDRPWAIDRLGKLRIEQGAYVWKKLFDSGARIINGTDAPVEPVDPIACFFASVTRQTLAGMPEGGYEPSQKMTRDQALKTYTIDAAYGGFEEEIKGSIEVGKVADFTVFSQNIMTIPDADILKTKVDYTIVGGEVKYERLKNEMANK